jgi:hypothetical protein
LCCTNVVAATALCHFLAGGNEATVDIDLGIGRPCVVLYSVTTITTASAAATARCEIVRQRIAKQLVGVGQWPVLGQDHRLLWNIKELRHQLDGRSASVSSVSQSQSDALVVGVRVVVDVMRVYHLQRQRELGAVVVEECYRLLVALGSWIQHKNDQTLVLGRSANDRRGIEAFGEAGAIDLIISMIVFVSLIDKCLRFTQDLQVKRRLSLLTILRATQRVVTSSRRAHTPVESLEYCSEQSASSTILNGI